MSENNAPKAKKSHPFAVGCLILCAVPLLLLTAALLLHSGVFRQNEDVPEYIRSARPRVEQRMSELERQILANAEGNYDPDTTISALFSMENALRKAENFEQMTEYIVQDSPEKVAPEIQLLKYRFFQLCRKQLSNRETEKELNSLYSTARSALLDFASSVDPFGFTYNRAQAQKVWEKHQAEAKMSAELRKRVERSQEEFVDFLFSFMTLSARYYREWEHLCAFRDRAYLAAWKGDPGEVIANASAAVKLAPDEKEAHILLAMALLERNGESDLALAESLLDDFLKKHPSSASGHLLRGVAKIRAKRSGEAATDFAQAAVYFPKQQEELSSRLGIYRKRAYLNKSMEGRIIVNAYRAMMSGSGYFSPDFQLARLLLESGRREEARRKIFDHFFRRRMQGEWDKVLDDFRFSWRFLNTELFRIDAGAAETLKLSIDSAFFTNSVILNVKNDGKEPLHNVTVLLCVRFTDMFKGDYISFPVGETLAALPPGRSVEIGRRGIGEVSERILGVKKKFKDIIEYAAVVISDETISWIESKKVGDILPDPPEETSVPAKESQRESTVEAFAEKVGKTVEKNVSGAVRKLWESSGKQQPPAEREP